MLWFGSYQRLPQEKGEDELGEEQQNDTSQDETSRNYPTALTRKLKLSASHTMHKASLFLLYFHHGGRSGAMRSSTGSLYSPELSSRSPALESKALRLRHQKAFTTEPATHSSISRSSWKNCNLGSNAERMRWTRHWVLLRFHRVPPRKIDKYVCTCM